MVTAPAKNEEVAVTRAETSREGLWPKEDLTVCALCSQPTYVCDREAECENSTPDPSLNELSPLLDPDSAEHPVGKPPAESSAGRDGPPVRRRGSVGDVP